MRVKFIACQDYDQYYPLTAHCSLADYPIGRMTLRDLQLAECMAIGETEWDTLVSRELWLWIKEEAFISQDDLKRLFHSPHPFPILEDKERGILGWIGPNENPDFSQGSILRPHSSILLKYPWHLLDLNELYLNRQEHHSILGIIKPGAVIDGIVSLGKGSVLLPGTYIEGKVQIGENCKIGPNCYLRGPISIGNKVHIGNAVEIKASIIGDESSIGHLSYVGDSIIGKRVNLGAGTITANFRHDGQHHRMMVKGELINTQRRKLGCLIGDGVHTGIHTSIYPGRILGPYTETLPGAIVRQNLSGKSE